MLGCTTHGYEHMVTECTACRDSALGANARSAVRKLEEDLAEAEKEQTLACEGRDQWKRSCQAAISQRDTAWAELADAKAALATAQNEQAHLQFCLNSRDEFIGNEGLWMKYVDTLPHRKAGIAGGWSEINPVAELADTKAALEAANAKIVAQANEWRIAYNESYARAERAERAEAELARTQAEAAVCEAGMRALLKATRVEAKALRALLVRWDEQAQSDRWCDELRRPLSAFQIAHDTRAAIAPLPVGTVGQMAANERAEAREKALRQALELVDADVRHHLRSDVIAHALIRKNVVAAVRAALAEAHYYDAINDLHQWKSAAWRAEAEAKALREALEWIETKAMLAKGAGEFEAHSILRGIAHTARAALDPSPAGREG